MMTPRGILARWAAGWVLGMALLAGAPLRMQAAPDWTVEQAEKYIGKDLPQQFAWRHSGDVTAALPTVANAAPLPQTAGDWDALKNLRLSLENRISYEKDELLFGRGLDVNSSLYGTLETGKWQLGLGLTYNNHHNYGEAHLRQDSGVVDLFALYEVLPQLHLGGFVDFTYSETAQRTFTWTAGTVTVGGEQYRLGAGVLATYQYALRDYTLTLTTSLASMNKTNVAALWSTTYTSWASMAAVHKSLTKKLGVQVYASYLQLLAGPDTLNRDMNFVTVGTEFDYQLGRRCTARLGYERTLLYTDFENHAVTLGVDWSF